MNREPISEVTTVKLTTRELSNIYIRANFTGRSVSLCIAKKVCISCHKGFNKKRVECEKNYLVLCWRAAFLVMSVQNVLVNKN